MTEAARRTLRTALQTVVALLPLLADGGAAADVPALAGVVAVAAAVSRVMALPEVDRLLPHWLRKEAGP
ncbi:hypothetical protein GTY65_32505 [Streptomyces sp. SID8379]|uniref:hypothetical protein n=1 Tax=unclassified Streptomyces TaxID=2593676 RepID=UPI00037BEDB3|nr:MULTISPECIES: hypothetical protein [unclassified Streptomyces]MYW68765.1 hypothetical protein [Streptomyces sp. SID8379]